jgi:transcriptional regulator with GAF, ATPase, and Fis domain
LRLLVELLETDRASLIRLAGGSAEIRLAWGRPELIEPRPLRRVPGPLRWAIAELRAGRRLVLGSLPEDLPPEAVAEREYSQRIGMRANLTVPLTVSGRFLWSIATGSFRGPRRWSETDVQRLESVGEILVAAAERVELELELSARLEELEELHERLRVETDYLRAERSGDFGQDEIVGRSPVMLRMLEQVAHVAPTPSTVLLLGETGTGKELLARAIHARSPRRDGPLVKINCAAVPDTLIESELFGHEKGAFTGATAARPGRFAVAEGGTLLLDEIGDLPAEVQIRLLRVLQDREFQPLGSNRTVKADVRIIAATHRDLAEEVRAGRFRSDLFFRLNVFPIRVPPLRDRSGDIPLLAWAFVERFQEAIGRRIRHIQEQDLAALAAYSWPGNVRELQNVIERALILSKGETLAIAEAFGFDADGGRASQPQAPAPNAGAERLEDLERSHIERVLAACGGKISGPGGAAERLGLHPNTLRSRMQKRGIRR